METNISALFIGVIGSATTIFIAILTYFYSRKQSSREFVARERVEWLKETRARYTRFIELISKTVNRVGVIDQNESFQRSDNKLVQEIDDLYSQVYEHGTYLSMMFNPSDISIINKISELLKNTNNFVTEKSKSKYNEIYNKIGDGIDLLNIEMRNYFKYEWEQIKNDVSYKKESLLKRSFKKLFNLYPNILNFFKLHKGFKEEI